MGGSITQGPVCTEPVEDELVCSGEARGPVGICEDPTLYDHDTPGTVGVNDAATVPAACTFRVPETNGGRCGMSPREFHDLYRNTPVYYLEGDSCLVRRTTADVHIYVNAGIERRRANMSEKDALVGAIRRELRKPAAERRVDVRSSDRVKVATVFFGKGSPSDVALTVSYAVLFGRTTAANVQHYCDEEARIGLDCSGFVNSYFVLQGTLNEAQTISAYARRDRVRATADEVQALDVLVWDTSDGAASGHIAVVSTKPRGSDRMVVVESSGSKEGLAVSTYTIQRVTNGLFHVDRGGTAAGGTSTSDVRVYRV